MTAAEKTADLCWGQRYIWLRQHQLPADAQHETHIVSSFPLPPDAPLIGVRTMLNYLVRRHEALRTTYELDGDGVPRQRVHPPRGLPLVTASTESTGAESPAAVLDRLTNAPFDLATEWPIRACVVLAGGRPSKLVLVLNHMAFDAWTVDRFEQELRALGAAIGGGRQVALPPVRHQPVDLAEYEASAAARVDAEPALAYWREEIRQLPTDGFARRRRPAPETGPAAHSASLTSPDLLAASRRIAADYQVWPSAVHLTAYAMLTAGYAGADGFSTLAFTGNRDAGRYPDVMTCMFSPLLMRLDCPAEAGFAEILAAAAARFEQGQQHSYLPYDELLELIAADSDRRGAPVRLGAEFNFLSRASQDSKARRTRLVTNPVPASWASYGADCYLRVYELRDAAVVSLQAAGAVLDAETTAAFLRGYERLLLLPAPELARIRVAELAELAGFSTPGQPAEQPAQSARQSDRSAGQPPADGAAERALVATIAELNGLSSVDLARNYVTAGGRVLRIPAVLARLAALGWTGLAVYDLAGGLPLATLAGRLVQSAEQAA
ncbi:MAG TPA: condensation domain-containing protein [Jatrophihabitans sp.]|nr:condensation domain-containing protein [Jatrophihabitans sp.]